MVSRTAASLEALVQDVLNRPLLCSLVTDCKKQPVRMMSSTDASLTKLLYRAVSSADEVEQSCVGALDMLND